MSERILSTLLIGALGLVVGYLAQRSRMCFVAGLRDYILVRDRELLTGLFAFLVTVWTLTSIFYALNLLEQRMPEYGELQVASSIRPGGGLRGLAESFRGFRLLGAGAPGTRGAVFGSGTPNLGALLGRFFWTSLGGGALIGFLSVLAGGCVLRQHVLCAQGNRDALLFILGFYAAAVVFALALYDWLFWFYG